MPSKDSEIASLPQRLLDLDAQRSAIQAQLAALLDDSLPNRNRAEPAGEAILSDGEKVALFRRLFAPPRRLCGSLGEPQNRSLRLRAGVFQRVGCGYLR
jgi:hypothetical protein